MKKTTGPYPVLTVDGGGSSVVPHAGATLLLRTAQTVGLTAGLSKVLAPWRKPLAIHDPAKIVLDLAVSLAMGGTVWPTSPSSVPARRCSDWSPRTRPCRGASTPWPPTPRLRWRRSTLRARPPVRGHGHWPVSTPPITPRMLRRRW